MDSFDTTHENIAITTAYALKQAIEFKSEIEEKFQYSKFFDEDSKNKLEAAINVAFEFITNAEYIEAYHHLNIAVTMVKIGNTMKKPYDIEKSFANSIKRSAYNTIIQSFKSTLELASHNWTPLHNEFKRLKQLCIDMYDKSLEDIMTNTKTVHEKAFQDFKTKFATEHNEQEMIAVSDFMKQPDFIEASIQLRIIDRDDQMYRGKRNAFIPFIVKLNHLKQLAIDATINAMINSE